jgi:hypothetical protein
MNPRVQGIKCLRSMRQPRSSQELPLGGGEGGEAEKQGCGLRVSHTSHTLQTEGNVGVQKLKRFCVEKTGRVDRVEAAHPLPRHLSLPLT